MTRHLHWTPPALGLAAALATALPLSGQDPSRPATPAPKAAPNEAGGRTPNRNGDIELVERLITARREYQMSLERLRAYYVENNDAQRARWAEEELLAYHRSAKQSFRLDVGDVPPPTLEPKFNVQEANELYRRGMVYKSRGLLSDYTDNQRRAELLFQQLLTQYPRCDKIADAAYQLGELYEGRAFRQYRRAAAYFERSFQWAKGSNTDARLRAARIYDRQLGERTRAVELYQEVIDHDTAAARIQEAERRLAELSPR